MEKYFDEDTRKRLKGKENCWYKSVEKEHGGVAAREYFITQEYKHGKDRGKKPADNEENSAGGFKLVKESYGLSLKRIRYAISLDYENEVEKYSQC